MIDLKVERYVIGLPYRVQWPAAEQRRIEAFYLELLAEPRTKDEILPHLMDLAGCDRDMAMGLHLTLCAMFFSRQRMVDDSFGVPGPKKYWATQHGLQYLVELKAKGAA
jgi:hypothetical protein